MTPIFPITRRMLLLAGLAMLSPAWVCADLPNEEEILKKGGKEAAIIIEKARDILGTSQVFASRGIGEGGTPTASCWALTVLVRYDADAKETFNQLFESESAAPELRLYAIAALVALNPDAKKRFADALPSKLASTPVQTQFGCVGETSRFDIETYKLLSNGPDYYIFKDLPSLYRTCTVERRQE